MIDNQKAARILFEHRLATQEQIMAYWPQITATHDIGALLVAGGILPKATYEQLLQHLNPGAPKETSPVTAEAQTPLPPPRVKPEPKNEDSQRNLSATQPSASGHQSSVFAWLKQARNANASDLHLSSGNPPYMRRHGHFEKCNEAPIRPDEMRALIQNVLSADDFAQFEKTGDLETVIENPEIGRCRVALIQQRNGFDFTARLIPNAIRTFEESALPESCRELCHWAQGLVLVTGPAGCGKTSTLATLVELVNHERHDHIITLEEPVEIVFTPSGCQITQREIGKHTRSREAALRAALREDPDIIVISELRDLATIQLAVSAAETGHLVFGTMNTINASRTIYRLIDSFPPEEQPIIRNMVSESLRGVVSQQLIPLKDGQGVVPAYEVLLVNTAVANMIRKDEAHQLGTAMITGKNAGMVLLDDSLRRLIEAGIIEGEEAYARANTPKDFERYLGRR